MMCKNCRQARKHAGDSVWCVMYGMIISETHECRDEDTVLPWEKEEKDSAPAGPTADAHQKKGLDTDEV